MDSKTTAKDKAKGTGPSITGIIVIGIVILSLIGTIISSKNKDIEKLSTTKPYELPRDSTYERIVAEKNAKATSSNAEAVKKLSKLATFRKDEFKGITWVEPKGKPAYRNRNGIYCYFSKEGSEVSNFRFVIQYLSDDWLFIEDYRFVIDGKSYTYTPMKVDRDNGDGDIWEWSDEKVSDRDLELIEALANAKTAKIRFEGSQYYKVKAITTAQLKSIKDMLSLYKAMGGTFTL